MGGEGGPDTTVPATLSALKRHPEMTVLLVGDEERIAPALELARADTALLSRLQLCHTPDVFLDTDKPAAVLRSGQDTSIYRCIELHRQGLASAVVSAGNTGALLMLGRHLLKTITGIELPAIVATLPLSGSNTLLLDVGANLACSPLHLEQFAIMGSVLARAQFDCAPRVALLNVGAEDYKGTDDVRAAAELLESNPAIDFLGFLEANQVFSGLAEVIVCNGFVGNVMIKASAGAANAVRAEVLRAQSDSAGAQTGSAALDLLNPQRFNGASLLGLCGNVIKSHGNADVLGFSCAIDQAYREQTADIPELIRQAVA
jgi:glycerol-3-phosphate acyltransferase PlsX